MLVRGERWLWKDDGLMLSHRGAHCCLRGVGGRGEILTWQPAVKHQIPAAKITNSNCCDHAAAQVKQKTPEQPVLKEQQVVYWANIEKRNQINTKNYWKYKRRLCVKLFEVTNTTWENLQIAKHKSVQCAEWMTLMSCNLMIFSGCACHLEQLHAQSPFLFPIVFGIMI